MNLVGPILAFSVTTLLIVVLRPIAVAKRLVDVPSGRKTHTGDIPLIGGMAIFLGSTFAFLAQFSLAGFGGALESQFLALFLAAFILIVVGVWDDMKDLPPFTKFAAQIVAALVMVFGGGVVLNDLGSLLPGGGLLQLGWLSVPFTVFACIGVINAMNMCDGLDGLSGSLALIALLGFGIANSMWGAVENQHLIVVLAACVSSFLLFNLRTLWRSRAWVFLGDAGSMLLGISLCWLAIGMSQGEARVLSPSVALWFLMMPIFDTVTMMIRRLAKNRSPFEADREHLHHIFLLAGFTVGESVTLISGFAVVGVVIGLTGTYFAVPDGVMAGLFIGGATLYFWVMRRAWTVMRFLRRSICRRRKNIDRRCGIDRRQYDDPQYSGGERRIASTDRRQLDSRRELDGDA